MIIKVALQDPIPYYDMVISKEVLEQWEPETLKVLPLFDELISKTTHPLIHLAIIEAARWDAYLHKLTSVQQKAREVLARRPETHALRVMRALTNGYDFYTGLDDSDFNTSYEAHQKEIGDERQLAVDEFLQHYPDATKGLFHLNSQLIEILEVTGTQPFSGSRSTAGHEDQSIMTLLLKRPDERY